MFLEIGSKALFRMSKLIKAAILRNTNSKLEVENIFCRKLLKGQVLVKIFYSGVCRSQLMEVKGFRGKDQWLPHLLGHEASGIVMSTGPGVKKVKKGSEVILTWIKGKGIEAVGAKYTSKKNETINSGQVTTFSNYSVVSENRIIKKPKGLPFDIAVLYGCALPTGAGMVVNQLDIKKSNSLIVYGLGGIGISAMLTALAKGVTNILAIDNSKKKLDYAKKLSIKTLNSNDKNFDFKLKKIFINGADFCIESCGKTETIEHAFSLINNSSGKLYFASHPKKSEKIKLSPHELIQGKEIYGSWGGSSVPDRDTPIFYELFKKGSSKKNLKNLITKEYSLEQINVALKDLENGKVFRPLVKMKH